MTFNWREFLSVAEYLKDCNDDCASHGAFLRSSVSRSYYAAFCAARNYAEEKLGFIPTRGAEDHKTLRECYKARNNTAISSKLDDLRKWRNDCDYQDHIDGIEAISTNALKHARNVLGKLKV